MPQVSVYIYDRDYLRYIKNRKYWNQKFKEVFNMFDDPEDLIKDD